MAGKHRRTTNVKTELLQVSACQDCPFPTSDDVRDVQKHRNLSRLHLEGVYASSLHSSAWVSNIEICRCLIMAEASKRITNVPLLNTTSQSLCKIGDVQDNHQKLLQLGGSPTSGTVGWVIINLLGFCVMVICPFHIYSKVGWETGELMAGHRKNDNAFPHLF